MTGVQTCALPICFPVTIRGLLLSQIRRDVVDYNPNEKLNILAFEMEMLGVAPLSGIVHVAVPTDVISFNITNPVGGTTPLFEVSLYGEYV